MGRSSQVGRVQWADQRRTRVCVSRNASSPHLKCQIANGGGPLGKEKLVTHTEGVVAVAMPPMSDPMTITSHVPSETSLAMPSSV